MKKILISFCAFAFLSAFGQSSKNISWSSPRKQSAQNVTNIFHANEDEFFTYGVKRSKGLVGGGAQEVHISKYAKDKFKRLWNEKVSDYKYDGIKATFEDVYHINGETFLFMETFNKKEEKKYLLLKIISDNGEASEFILLDEVNTSSRRRGDLFIRVSKDGEKFAVLSRPKSKKKDAFSIKIKVFNYKVEELWAKELELDLMEKEVNINDVQVSNDGEIFAVIDDIGGLSAKRKNNLTDFRIVKVSSDSKDDVEELSINVKAFLASASLEIDNQKEKAILTSTYSDKRGSNMAGVFIGVIDQHRFDLESYNYAAFPKQFIDQAAIHMKTKDGKLKGQDNLFKTRALIETSDGGTLLVKEFYKFYVVERTDANGIPRSTEYHYLYNHVIVSKIDVEGELEWCEFVPKVQHTVNDDGIYSGLAINYREGVLTMLFNDNPKNAVQLKKNKRLKNTKMKGSVLVAVQIDDEGNSTRKVLQDNKRQKIILQPKNTIISSVENTEYITMGAYYFTIFSSRDFRFGIIRPN